MDFNAIISTLQSSLGTGLPSILGALLLLAASWVVALISAAIVHRVFVALNANKRYSGLVQESIDLSKLASRIVFWFVMLIGFVGALNALDLEVLSAPFANMINDILVYLPRLIAGLALTIVGWIIAVMVRAAVTKLFDKTGLNARLSDHQGGTSVGENLGHASFWIVALMFLPLVLGSLALDGLLGPVQSMINEILSYLPNVLGAAIIAFVGYFVARIVQGIVTNLLTSMNAQRLAVDAGLGSHFSVPQTSGVLVFILIFVPALISALQSLQIDAISGPATDLLTTMVSAIPHLIAAALILGLTYYVVRFVARVASKLLAGLGADKLPAKLRIESVFGGSTLSVFVGQLIVVFGMLFAAVEASDRLAFTQVRDLVTAFIGFGADILLGIVILAIGLWLANLASAAIAKSGGKGAQNFGTFIRVVIIALVLAMGLRAMGVADSIVNMAFGLTAGSIAVAAALAFGLGARETAGKLAERWLSRWTKG